MAQIYPNYLDILVQPGCDLNFNFSVTPMAMTGAAVMVVDGLPGSPFTVTTSNSNIGVNPYLNFSLRVQGATGPDPTNLWPPGTYDYRVIATLSDGSVDEVVTGIVMVKTVAVID